MTLCVTYRIVSIIGEEQPAESVQVIRELLL